METVMVLALTLGTPLVWALLLNLRDRREARLLQSVLPLVGSRDLRGRVAVRVRCSLLWPRSRVEVSVLSWSVQELWELMTRLSERLSPRVRLELTGPADRILLATFTVEGLPSLATG